MTYSLDLDGFCFWRVFLDRFDAFPAGGFRFVSLASGDYLSVRGDKSEAEIALFIFENFEFCGHFYLHANFY